MAASLIPVHTFSEPYYPKLHHYYCKPISSWRQRSVAVKCCVRQTNERRKTKKNHYELLGVSVNSEPKEIKEAYRKLQKIYHPDIAGHEGHEHTLLLNEAYNVLMKEDLRKEYDASIGAVRIGLGKGEYGFGYSTWNGPIRLQALFVDENACIGCRECIHHAGNTFMWDEALGCARVKVQYGDEDQNIEVSVDSCPVNCIHYVDKEELAVLEYLIRPKIKEGYGIFGQGWERPANVFMAANTFSKQLKQQAECNHRTAQPEQETPAQAEARENASIKLKMERFSNIWNWVKEISGQ